MIIMKRKLEDRLLEWKNKGSKRMPLIINGARQVGKTYTLLEFGSKNYKNVVYVNLETNLLVSSYFSDNINPNRIIQYLEAYSNQEIIPEETLIILDEIQSCERALTALKYFYEETPEYHIATAGSLLGVAINREKYSYPVGKVDTITLYPLDFEEYLWALNEHRLCSEIRSSYIEMAPMPEALHQRAIDLYRMYLIIGGMPASINEYLDTGKLLTVSDIQSKILNDYLADMSKYASHTESVKIRACYESIPAQLAKENRKFQYKIVQKGGTASIFGPSIDWLNYAGIVLKCQRIEHAFEPIAVYSDLSSFKLYMGDTGLLVMKSGLSHQTILSGEKNLFMGSVAENYIAQALASKEYNLYYWTSKNTAELDFVLQLGNDIIGVEVKKETHSRSKSLGVFIDKYNPKYSIRFSNNNFGFANNIKSIPLYAVFCI
ncbi:MAG: ATP-binding protein [Clostridiales bacterium]|nr:ATP-binding protein [Clostridiales bacterium]